MAGKVQRVKCPVCGTWGEAGDFCEMGCGRLAAPAGADASAPAAAASPEAPARPAAPATPVLLPEKPETPVAPKAPAAPVAPVAPLRPEGWGAAAGADLELEWDALCVFFEGMPGVMRFRLTAGRRVERVQLTLENPLTLEVLKNQYPLAEVDAGTKREVWVSVPKQEAGGVAWYVKVEYEANGRARELVGQVPVYTSKPQEARKTAENLSVTINNNISNGNASDVTLSQRTVDDLVQLSHSDNPYEDLKQFVQGGKRAWAQMSLDRAAGVSDLLPPMPPEAAADRLTLVLGGGRLHLFAGRIVTLGRSRGCDIPLRHWVGAPPSDQEAFLLVSRRHCHFEVRGERVTVTDGCRDGMFGVKPSSGGTYWNGTRLQGPLTLETGEGGTMSFAGPESYGAVALDAKVCPAGGSCATCSRTDRTWCGGGKHPCLLLRRRKGAAEAYAVLWSCFPLGTVDRAYDGVTLFREGSGFAWRRGRQCGWLVPGSEFDTEYGRVYVTDDFRMPGPKVQVQRA